jgi:protein subunit release factor A
MTTVRSYVLNPVKRITDHRTGRAEPDPQAVLDGQLDGFIDDAIRMRAEQRRRGDGGKGGALRGGDGKGPTPTEI